MIDDGSYTDDDDDGGSGDVHFRNLFPRCCLDDRTVHVVVLLVTTLVFTLTQCIVFSIFTGRL